MMKDAKYWDDELRNKWEIGNSSTFCDETDWDSADEKETQDFIKSIQKDAYDYGYLQGMIVTALSISNGEIKAEDVVKALSRLDELEKRMKELNNNK